MDEYRQIQVVYVLCCVSLNVVCAYALTLLQFCGVYIALRDPTAVQFYFDSWVDEMVKVV